MTDRELLELAAKAAGIVGGYAENHPEFGADWVDPGIWHTDENDCTASWNPLDDDGDALRLAVKLRLVIHVWDELDAVSVAKTLPDGEDPVDSRSWFAERAKECGSLEAATRRAIVRAAAEIQRAKEAA